MMSNKWIQLFIIFLVICSKANGSEIFSTNCELDKGFPIKNGNIIVRIYCDSTEKESVKIAAKLLSADIEMVTGKKPKVVSNVDSIQDYSIIIGTVGESQLIKQLSESGIFQIDSIKGKWECFAVKTIDSPFFGGEKCLVIAGSDRRGTAYGVFELSKAIGVSPWYWWADVTPKFQDSLSICPLDYISEEPTVKYRGIFINDEDWGLQEWSEHTFDTVKDIGPKTYEKIFELLLRLKANYVWPAMHPCTKPFNYYADNKEVADRYAIIMGSSHHEPLLYNTHEWPYDENKWNPFTNMELIMSELESRVASNGMYENIYTVGIRGTDDRGFSGGSSLDDKTARLEEVIDLQRNLLKKYVDSSITEVPQVFWPYKEVLEQYNNNMELPDDITLGWVDDNYGYIRQVSTPAEKTRSGGSGVYYHISYYGKPSDYLWVGSTSPALIATEMKKAADFGGNRIWVFNVGDIKPGELLMNYCLDLAWDYNKWGAHNTREYIYNWISYNFGNTYAEDVTDAYMKYFQLAQSGRPEHINMVKFSNKEIDERLAAYAEIDQSISMIYDEIHNDLKDAFFETVYYPIIGASLMNQKFLYAHKSFSGVVSKDPDALIYSQKAKEAHKAIFDITNHFNTGIKNGKWNKIISCDIRNQDVYDMPEVATQTDVDQEYPEYNIDLGNGTFSAPMQYKNGLVYGNKAGLQTTQTGGRAEFTFDLDNAVSGDVYFYAKTPTDKEDSWFISVNGKQIIQNNLVTGQNFQWIKIISSNFKSGTNTIIISQREPNAQIAAIKITDSEIFKYADDYVKSADTIVPAWKFEKMHANLGYSWKIIEGLSTSGKAIINLPYTTPSVSNILERPYIEQNIELPSNSFTMEVRCLPTRRLYEGSELRIAISLNNNAPQEFIIHDPYPTKEWKNNVLQGYKSVKIDHIGEGAVVNVKIYALDAGVIIDKVLFYLHKESNTITDTTMSIHSSHAPPSKKISDYVYPNTCKDLIYYKFGEAIEVADNYITTDITSHILQKNKSCLMSFYVFQCQQLICRKVIIS